MAISIVLIFLPNIIFPGWVYLKYYGVIVLLSVYIFHTLISNPVLKINKNLSIYIYRYYIPVSLFFLFFIFLDTLALGLTQNKTFFRALTMLSFWALFGVFILILIIKLYKKTHNINLVILEIFKPYVFLSALIVLLSVLTLLFVQTETIDPYNYLIPDILGYEYTKVVDKSSDLFVSEDTLLFPGYLSLVFTDGRFFSIGLAGWSYEPHVATFFITPSLFLLCFYFDRALYFLYICYFIFFVAAASITNILALATVALVYFFYLLIHGRIRSALRFVAIIVFVFSLFFIFLSHESISQIKDFFLYKTIGNSSSRELSIGIINYILSPSEIFSSGGIFIIPTFENFHSLDIGLFGTIYYLTLYLFFFVGVVYLLIQKNSLSMSFGLGILYFLIHSIKVSMWLINYPFFMFMFFILILNIIAVKIRVNLPK